MQKFRLPRHKEPIMEWLTETFSYASGMGLVSFLAFIIFALPALILLALPYLIFTGLYFGFDRLLKPSLKSEHILRSDKKSLYDENNPIPEYLDEPGWRLNEDQLFRKEEYYKDKDPAEPPHKAS